MPIHGDKTSQDDKIGRDRDEDVPNSKCHIHRLAHIFICHPGYLANIWREASFGKRFKQLFKHGLCSLASFRGKVDVIKKGQRSDPEIFNVNPLTLKEAKVLVPP